MKVPDRPAECYLCRQPIKGVKGVKSNLDGTPHECPVELSPEPDHQEVARA